MDRGGERLDEAFEDEHEDAESWYFDLPSGAWERQEQKNRELRARLLSQDKSKKDEPEPKRDPFTGQPVKASRGLFGLGRKKQRETQAPEFKQRESDDERVPPIRAEGNDRPGRQSAGADDETQWKEAAERIDESTPLLRGRRRSDPVAEGSEDEARPRSRWDDMFGGAGDGDILQGMRDWAHPDKDEDATSPPLDDTQEPTLEAAELPGDDDDDVPNILKRHRSAPEEAATDDLEAIAEPADDTTAVPDLLRRNRDRVMQERDERADGEDPAGTGAWPGDQPGVGGWPEADAVSMPEAPGEPAPGVASSWEHAEVSASASDTGEMADPDEVAEYVAATTGQDLYQEALLPQAGEEELTGPELDADGSNSADARAIPPEDAHIASTEPRVKQGDLFGFMETGDEPGGPGRRERVSLGTAPESVDGVPDEHADEEVAALLAVTAAHDWVDPSADVPGTPSSDELEASSAETLAARAADEPAASSAEPGDGDEADQADVIAGSWSFVDESERAVDIETANTPDVAAGTDDTTDDRWVAGDVDDGIEAMRAWATRDAEEEQPHERRILDVGEPPTAQDDTWREEALQRLMNPEEAELPAPQEPWEPHVLRPSSRMADDEQDDAPAESAEPSRGWLRRLFGRKKTETRAQEHRQQDELDRLVSSTGATGWIDPRGESGWGAGTPSTSWTDNEGSDGEPLSSWVPVDLDTGGDELNVLPFPQRPSRDASDGADTDLFTMPREQDTGSPIDGQDDEPSDTAAIMESESDAEAIESGDGAAATPELVDDAEALASYFGDDDDEGIAAVLGRMAADGASEWERSDDATALADDVEDGFKPGTPESSAPTGDASDDAGMTTPATTLSLAGAGTSTQPDSDEDDEWEWSPEDMDDPDDATTVASTEPESAGDELPEEAPANAATLSGLYEDEMGPVDAEALSLMGWEDATDDPTRDMTDEELEGALAFAELQEEAAPTASTQVLGQPSRDDETSPEADEDDVFAAAFAWSALESDDETGTVDGSEADGPRVDGNEPAAEQMPYVDPAIVDDADPTAVPSDVTEEAVEPDASGLDADLDDAPRSSILRHFADELARASGDTEGDASESDEANEDGTPDLWAAIADEASQSGQSEDDSFSHPSVYGIPGQPGARQHFYGSQQEPEHPTTDTDERFLPEDGDDDLILRAFEAHAATEIDPEPPHEPEPNEFDELLGQGSDDIVDEGHEPASVSFAQMHQTLSQDGEEDDERDRWMPVEGTPVAMSAVAMPVGGADGSDGSGPYLDIDRPVPSDSASRNRKTRTLVRELVETGLLALLVFLAVRASFQNFKVDGNSMYPTLENGQFLIVNKLVYSEVDMERLSSFLPFVDAGDEPSQHVFHGPERGDIVVLHDPSNPQVDLIKRVIGLPGDKLEILDGRVYIDDYLLEEPYIVQDWHDDRPAVLIPDGHYFVMGDNRDNSKDSRSSAIGFVPEELVIGRAELSYWPLSEFGLAPNGDPTISEEQGRPVVTGQRIDTD